MSDLVAVLIVSVAPLVGMLLIGLPWLWWSKRRKAQRIADDLAAMRNVHFLMIDLAALSQRDAKVLQFHGERRRTRARTVVH
jgi:hypothetical protein